MHVDAAVNVTNGDGDGGTVVVVVGGSVVVVVGGGVFVVGGSVVVVGGSVDVEAGGAAVVAVVVLSIAVDVPDTADGVLNITSAAERRTGEQGSPSAQPLSSCSW